MISYTIATIRYWMTRDRLPTLEPYRRESLIRAVEADLLAHDRNREPLTQLWLEECLSDLQLCEDYYQRVADALEA